MDKGALVADSVTTGSILTNITDTPSELIPEANNYLKIKC